MLRSVLRSDFLLCIWSRNKYTLLAWQGGITRCLCWNPAVHLTRKYCSPKIWHRINQDFWFFSPNCGTHNGNTCITFRGLCIYDSGGLHWCNFYFLVSKRGGEIFCRARKLLSSLEHEIGHDAWHIFTYAVCRKKCVGMTGFGTLLGDKKCSSIRASYDITKTLCV